MSTTPSTEPRAAPSGLSLTVLIAAGMSATGFLHFTPSVLSPFLLDDFNWDRWQIGALVTVFSLSGAAGSPVMGRYADRIGGRNALFVLYSASTLSLLLLSVAPEFVVMLGVMTLAGFAASTANPSANKLIGTHIAPECRGPMMGLMHAGGPIGFSIAGLLPLLAGVVGWRWAALMAAALPAAGLVAAALLIPPDSRRPAAAIDERGSRRTPLVAWLAVQGFLIGAGSGGMLTFLPLYAKESLGFSATTAGTVTTSLGVVAVIGRVIWGRQHRRFADVGIPIRITTTAAIAAPLLVAVAASTSAALLWVGTAVGGVSFMAWNIFAMLAVVEGVPHQGAGRATGDVTVGYLAGFIPAPIIFGLLVDVTGSYTPGWLGVAGFFVGAAMVTSRVRATLTA